MSRLSEPPAIGAAHENLKDNQPISGAAGELTLSLPDNAMIDLIILVNHMAVLFNSPLI
ncbi:MAG: hypothetical protein ABF318_12620 [Ketobacter sp.]